MEEFKSKLVPIMRQGVAVIQTIFFKRLKDHLGNRYPESDASYVNMLTGAIVNDIFGTPNREEPFVTFARDNGQTIEGETRKVAFEMVDMMIPLTDALRIKVLCDQHEGIDSSSILLRANDLKILLIPREIPLPSRFITLVRELGKKYDILLPQAISNAETLH